MKYLRLALSRRYVAFSLTLASTIALLPLSFVHPLWAALFVVGVALSAVGVHDLVQTHHSILRSYPIIAHLRFMFEDMRAEIRQYFFENDTEGVPFSRNKRAIVYQRAKGALDKRPFGTLLDVYATAHEWLNHSMSPTDPAREPFRVTVGGPHCTKPYSASILNISGMSFGAISANAVRALNIGAKKGNFAHDTGEGGVSRYHQEGGGDLVWQIGSGYFGCRAEDGGFSPSLFEMQAELEQIRMIEIKMSQGAKPGHGGVLPGAKVTAEIAAARGVQPGVDCVSPPRHQAFATPLALLAFIGELRRRSGGKPIGMKLCVGHPWEFLGVCKAMLETGDAPDFIVVDGAEGGTGAAPLEFVDHMGMPLRDGLMFVHNALIGTNLRDKIRLGASGKVTSAFDMARLMALGADWCNAARGFMFAIGCIQAQSCHTGRCPTGVATQDKIRQRSLVVPDKAERVYQFHHSTLEALAEVVAAAGLHHPSELKPCHLSKRVSANLVQSYDRLYHFLEPGELIEGTVDPRFAGAWKRARADSFSGAP
jgi:glutamate synthase domain-containing protein 2